MSELEQKVEELEHFKDESLRVFKSIQVFTVNNKSMHESTLNSICELELRLEKLERLLEPRIVSDTEE